MANQPTPHAADPSAGGMFQAFSSGQVHGCWCLRNIGGLSPVVIFSCEGRGVRPSCNTRRTVETGSPR